MLGELYSCFSNHLHDLITEHGDFEDSIRSISNQIYISLTIFLQFDNITKNQYSTIISNSWKLISIIIGSGLGPTVTAVPYHHENIPELCLYGQSSLTSHFGKVTSASKTYAAKWDIQKVKDPPFNVIPIFLVLVRCTGNFLLNCNLMFTVIFRQSMFYSWRLVLR